MVQNYIFNMNLRVKKKCMNNTNRLINVAAITLTEPDTIKYGGAPETFLHQ